MKRNKALDILKLSMSFMIVGLHSNFLYDFNKLASYIAVNGLFRIAVPVFLIINGFYFHQVVLNNYQYDWIKRFLSLYVIWMGFYSYFWFPRDEFSFFWFAKFIYAIVIGYWHLWYVSGMIGAAILLLILRNYSFVSLAILIILFFLTGVLIQYIGVYHIFANNSLNKLFSNTAFHRNVLFLSFPFFCIGYILNKHSLHKLVSKRLSCAISIIGIFFLVIESYSNYKNCISGGFSGGFDNLFFLILACPFIFIFFIKLNFNWENKKISLYSSSIYFIHAFILIIFSNFTELPKTTLTIFVILISIFFSYFIIKINNRLKFLL